MSQNEDESDYLPTFKAQEEKIALQDGLYRQLEKLIYPCAPMCHPCSGYPLFCLARRSSLSSLYPKNARLYEAPLRTWLLLS